MLSAPQIHEWEETELHRYQVTASLLAAAIDARHQQQLAALHGQHLAVVDERRRLAQELHDSVTQQIFGTSLIAQTLASAWRRDPAEGERRTARLLELSQAALSEMRALLVELQPPASSDQAITAGETRLDRHEPVALGVDGTTPIEAFNATPPTVGGHVNLPTALWALANDRQKDGPRIALTIDGYEPRSVIIETALYRIAQEALNNVIKHANASRVTIQLRDRSTGLLLSVADNGRGFHPSPDLTIAVKEPRTRQPSAQSAGDERMLAGGASTPTGLVDRSLAEVIPGGAKFGLANMQARAKALAARLTIETARNQGTTISLVLPPRGRAGRS